MHPTPVESPPPLARREKLPRVGYGLNGALFLVSAWEGLESHGPLWSVVLNAVLGAIQLVTLVRSRQRPVPERLAYGLASVGLFATAVQLLHHSPAIPIGYGLAGLLNALFAIRGRSVFHGLLRKETP